MPVQEGGTSWHLDDTFECTKMKTESFQLLDCSDRRQEGRSNPHRPLTFTLLTENRLSIYELWDVITMS